MGCKNLLLSMRSGQQRSRFDGDGQRPQHGGGVAWGGARMSMSITPNITESFRRCRRRIPDAGMQADNTILRRTERHPSPISRFKPRGLSARG